MKEKDIPRAPLICVADIDTRLGCGAICVICAHFVCDRRHGERRDSPRRTRDRRLMNRQP
jgi:hypothetical protein